MVYAGGSVSTGTGVSLRIFGLGGWFRRIETDFGYAIPTPISSGSTNIPATKEHSPDCGWTETHIQYAMMGGFQLVREDGSKQPLYEKAFVNYVLDGTIDVPRIALEQIQDRSKGDTISNVITVLQAAWFVIQCIHRAWYRLPVTELEITTLAHVLINFFVYWSWWNKPSDVGLAVNIHAKQSVPVPSNLDHVEHRLGRKSPREVQVDSAADNSQPRSGTSRARADSLGPVAIADVNSASEQNHNVLSCLRPPASTVSSPARGEPTQEALPPLPTSADDLYSGTYEHHVEGDRDWPRLTSSKVVEDSEKLVLLPSDSVDEKQEGESDKAKDLESNIESSHTPHHQSLSLRVRLGLKVASLGDNMDTIGEKIFWSVIVFSIAGAFGAIHCLAWNSHFPTRAEQIIWQTSSLIVAIIGGGSFIVALNVPDDSPFFEDIDKSVISFVTVVFPCALYCCARICLLVLALLALRSLPFEAFVSPSWPSIIPHVG